jgi:MFS transporter, Spinster family, sphingosine-1-phosphate transporter
VGRRDDVLHHRKLHRREHLAIEVVEERHRHEKAFLILFGVGWGFFDSNNVPILCQIVRPELRATGYGIMNLVSISCGGLADWGFGTLRDRHVPLFGIFGAFASAAVLSIVLVLMIRPRDTESESVPKLKHT